MLDDTNGVLLIDVGISNPSDLDIYNRESNETAFPIGDRDLMNIDG